MENIRCRWLLNLSVMAPSLLGFLTSNPTCCYWTGILYRFNRVQFQELIKYVWRGGYPRWKDEVRPGYVTKMRNNILQNRTGIFEGIAFEDT